MYTRSYWLQYLAERVAYDLRNEMYRHLETLSFSYYDTAQTGQLLSRATEDVNNIRRFHMFGLRMAAQSGLLLLGVMPSWNHSRSWGYGPSGVLGLVLVIVLVLVIIGEIHISRF